MLGNVFRALQGFLDLVAGLKKWGGQRRFAQKGVKISMLATKALNQAKKCICQIRVELAAAQRGLSLCQALLRAQLGQRVNVMILEKALTLELEQFEDSEFYDKLTRARREASVRPLSLVMRSFGLAQNAVSLSAPHAHTFATPPPPQVTPVPEHVPQLPAFQVPPAQ